MQQNFKQIPDELVWIPDTGVLEPFFSVKNLNRDKNVQKMFDSKMRNRKGEKLIPSQRIDKWLSGTNVIGM